MTSASWGASVNLRCVFNFGPYEVMMIAAHRSDLDAARSFGLRTGFIHRPNEYGPIRRADTARVGDYEVVANDTLDLATKLGA